MTFETETHSESVATLPTPVTSGKTDRSSPMGVDIGNGSLKLVSSQGATKIKQDSNALSR